MTVRPAGDGQGAARSLRGEAVMTKHDLLEHLAEGVSADATEIADRFGLTYAAAAMALLRLARQGLVLCRSG
jgi:DNA-binding MarR family transcriptional regulator